MLGVAFYSLSKRLQKVCQRALRGVQNVANFKTATLLQNYVEPIFMLLQMIAQDQNRSEGLLRASMGVVG
jgi:hypothetical protein